MSRIGKKPIPVPEGVAVNIEGRMITVSGKLGTVALPFSDTVSVIVGETGVTVATAKDGVQARADWGTIAALVRNAIAGVSNGFTKQLIVNGVGYRVALENDGLVLNLGFSHPVRFPNQNGVAITVEKNTITVSGVSKEKVGQVAAQIRKLKKPEPYKGKGIRYSDEIVRRKAGKKVAGTTG